MTPQERAAFSALDAKIKADPDIKQILDANRQQLAATRDKGGAARDFQNKIRDQVTAIAKQKGYLPNIGQAVFVNPNFEGGQLELHRGWAGLNGWQRAAIIAAAAATGIGAGVALAGAGGAAAAGGAGGASAAGGAGAAGTAAALPAMTSGIAAGTVGTSLAAPSLAGLGGAAAAGGTAAAIPAMTSGLATLPGTAMAAPTTAGLGGTAAAGAGTASKAGGIMKSLLSEKGLEMAGRGFSNAAQASANNRGVALDAMMLGDQNRMQLARDREASESDMIKKMSQLSYIKSGGSQGHKQVMSASGRPFTQFDFGLRPRSQEEMDMAGTLEQQLMERAKNPPTLSDYNSKMSPGKGETVMNWLGPVLTGASGIKW